MQSIQDLRIRREELATQSRALIDDNVGARFTPTIAAKVDSLHAEIDGIDRDIRRHERNIESGASHTHASARRWVGPDGRELPVAYAREGSIGMQLRGSFKNDAQGAEGAGIADFLRGIGGLKTTENVRNALQVGTDSSGGYLLPAYVQQQMLEALTPVSSLLTAGAGMSVLGDGGGGAKSYRIAAVNAIPTAAWRSESGTLATSEPTFRRVDLTPQSLAFQFKVSRELLADAMNLEQALYAAIAKSFAKEIDRAGLRGSGSAPEIRGILNTSGIQAVTNGTNGTSLATSAFTNFITATTAILAADGPMPTAAIMSPRSKMVLAGLLDTTNQPRQVPPALADMKLIATSQIPNNLTVGTGTTCSEIYVADFANLVFFMREGVSIQLLRELYAGTGEIGFACHMRVDVGVLYPAAFAVATGVLA